MMEIIIDIEVKKNNSAETTTSEEIAVVNCMQTAIEKAIEDYSKTSGAKKVTIVRRNNKN